MTLLPVPRAFKRFYVSTIPRLKRQKCAFATTWLQMKRTSRLCNALFRDAAPPLFCPCDLFIFQFRRDIKILRCACAFIIKLSFVEKLHLICECGCRGILYIARFGCERERTCRGDRHVFQKKPSLSLLSFQACIENRKYPKLHNLIRDVLPAPISLPHSNPAAV